MQYSQFEKILADTFSIKEKGLGAFRARLRHIRNLGVPDVPQRGSGNTVIYKTADLLTAFVALELQALGCAPAVSAELATFARGHFDEVEWSDDDVFLMVRNIPGLDDMGEERIRFIPEPFKKPPAGSAKVKIGPKRVRGAISIKSPFGGYTAARIIVGRDEAGSFATNPQALGSSLINLSARLRELPKDQ
jgi:hypothetical protein